MGATLSCNEHAKVESQIQAMCAFFMALNQSPKTISWKHLEVIWKQIDPDIASNIEVMAEGKQLFSYIHGLFHTWNQRFDFDAKIKNDMMVCVSNLHAIELGTLAERPKRA